MRYLAATLLLSTLLFAQNDILEIDSVDFQADDKKESLFLREMWKLEWIKIS